MSADSLDKLKSYNFPRHNNEEHEIVLRADGTCFFKSYWMYVSPNHPYQQYVESTGTWKIIIRDATLLHIPIKQWVIEINSQPVPELTGYHITTTLYFAFINRRLILWDYIGDPDRQEYVDFLRTSSDAK